MMRRISLGILAAAMLLPLAGAAQTPPNAKTTTAPETAAPRKFPESPADVAAMFGARPGVVHISLSPDGKSVAIIAPTKGQGAVLLTLDVDNPGAPKVLIRSSGMPDHLRYCAWSTNTQLVCTVSVLSVVDDDLTTFTRLVTVGTDGSPLKMMTARAGTDAQGIIFGGGDVIDWLSEGEEGKALITREFVPEGATGTNIGSSRQGLGVEQVDTRTLARRLIEPARQGAYDYISDGHGTVRIMAVEGKDGSGYNNGKIRYSFRKKGSRTWENLATDDGNKADLIAGFRPVAVDSTLDVVFGFAPNDGHDALFSIALDGSGKKTLVFARPDADIDGLVTIGRQARVVGVSFTTDRRETRMFDPVLKSFTAKLARAIPGLPLVSIVDASADENRLLLWAGSDSDPGKYFLFDRGTNQLSPLLSVRQAMENMPLATVKPITYAAADGTKIPAYLTLPAGSDGKNLPAIVLPHGGPAARDEWSFDWLPQFFAARGYAVLQPNYRGSTGYGDAWFQNNGFKSWRTAMSDVNDGGRWLTGQGIAAPGQLAIVGWSYGGYAALQTAALDADLFKAIVAIAPVTDLDALRDEWKNFTSYASYDRFIGRGDHVDAGSPARHADLIKAPVLLFHGDHDRNVGVGESRLMARRLKAAGRPVTYVEFKGLDHQLDDSAVRAEMLAKTDAFLRASLAVK